MSKVSPLSFRLPAHRFALSHSSSRVSSWSRGYVQIPFSRMAVTQSKVRFSLELTWASCLSALA